MHVVAGLAIEALLTSSGTFLTANTPLKLTGILINAYVVLHGNKVGLTTTYKGNSGSLSSMWPNTVILPILVIVGRLYRCFLVYICSNITVFLGEGAVVLKLDIAAAAIILTVRASLPVVDNYFPFLTLVTVIEVIASIAVGRAGKACIALRVQGLSKGTSLAVLDEPVLITRKTAIKQTLLVSNLALVPLVTLHAGLAYTFKVPGGQFLFVLVGLAGLNTVCGSTNDLDRGAGNALAPMEVTGLLLDNFVSEVVGSVVAIIWVIAEAIPILREEDVFSCRASIAVEEVIALGARTAASRALALFIREEAFSTAIAPIAVTTNTVIKSGAGASLDTYTSLVFREPGHTWAIKSNVFEAIISFCSKFLGHGVAFTLASADCTRITSWVTDVDSCVKNIATAGVSNVRISITARQHFHEAPVYIILIAVVRGTGATESPVLTHCYQPGERCALLTVVEVPAMVASSLTGQAVPVISLEVPDGAYVAIVLYGAHVSPYFAGEAVVIATASCAGGFLKALILHLGEAGLALADEDLREGFARDGGFDLVHIGVAGADAFVAGGNSER